MVSSWSESPFFSAAENPLPVSGVHLEVLSDLMHDVANGPRICSGEAPTAPTALVMAVALGDIEQQSLHDDKPHLLVEWQAAPAIALLGSGWWLPSMQAHASDSATTSRWCLHWPCTPELAR